MKRLEKDLLISQLKGQLTDWNTQWNLGKTKGIEEAIELVEAMPEDPETEEEHY